jgi:hypothetical protein
MICFPMLLHAVYMPCLCSPMQCYVHIRTLVSTCCASRARTRGSLKRLRKNTLASSKVMNPPDANEQTGDSLENLKRVMQLCGALHWVCAAPSPGLVFKCDLNPGLLSCTCKSSRATTMCAHIIAVTALYIPSTYSADYLRDLLKKLCKKGKKKAHRPRNALGGQYMQPEGMCLIYVLNLLTYACLCGHTLCYA